MYWLKAKSRKIVKIIIYIKRYFGAQAELCSYFSQGNHEKLFNVKLYAIAKNKKIRKEV